jgi:hypothetical protein
MLGSHVKIPDRPHHIAMDDRYEGDKNKSEMEGISLNDYHWLDNQRNCIGVDWLESGKVGPVKD